MPNEIPLEDILDSRNDSIYDIATNAPGPKGCLPLTESLLVDAPSGDIFGMSQNAGMGWEPAKLVQEQFLLISTQAGIRTGNGIPQTRKNAFGGPKDNSGFWGNPLGHAA